MGLGAAGLLLDRDAYQVPPLGPASVVVPDVGVAERIGQHEPGMAAALADAAVDDDVVVLLQPLLLFVDGAKLVGRLEGVVLGIDGAPPRDARRAGDVTASQRPLV